MDSKIEKSAKALKKQSKLQKQALQQSSLDIHIANELTISSSLDEKEMVEENRNNVNNQQQVVSVAQPVVICLWDI